MSHTLRRFTFLTIAGCLVAAGLVAQTTTQQGTFKPYSGQPGKDVVWVPTADVLVGKMLDMAKVTANDYVIDLGSGDGRTVIAAAKRGATAMGIEYNPEMVELSKANAAAAGVASKATFMKADIFESDYSKATVLTLFLLPELNLRLRPAILKMRPGTRVVSNSFRMDDWDPDDTASVEGECSSWCTAYLWIVPANVAGTWTTPQGDLTFAQTFQKVSGTFGTAAIADGVVRGTMVSFSANGTKYTGEVNGTAMDVRGPNGGRWRATKR